nr:ribonuclease H-like domain-containing protein [Tanacetum cinerariifolium]
MESLSPQVVYATKLPILNPNEFDLWKMRIEQYFLMTDYSLWEVILNAKKNELKARGTLLMALPDKHQLKFNSHKDAKTLMEAIKKRFGGNTETKKVQKTLLKQQYKNFSGYSTKSLDQIHDWLQKLISQLEILGVSLSQKDINLKFLRSLPSEWRTHILIWKNKTDLEEQSFDYLFNSLKIYESKIDADDFKEMDLKWQMTMLKMRARRFLQRTRRNIGANGPTSMGFDMSKVECYNCHRKGHFARECESLKDTRKNDATEPQRRSVPLTADFQKSQFDVISYQTCSESIEARLLVYKQNESVFEEDIKLLKLEVQLRDNSLVRLKQNLEKAEQERDDLKLNDDSLPSSPIYDRYRPGNGYNAIPLSYTGTFMPPKPDLVFNNSPNDVETDHSAFTVKLSHTKPCHDLYHTIRPSSPIIEDWVSDSEDESETKAHRMNMVPAAVLTQSKLVPIIAVRPVSTAVLKISVTRPKQVKLIVTKSNSPTRWLPNRSPSPKASNSPPRVTSVKAPVVNAAQGKQGKWEWRPKCLILDHGNPQHALNDKRVIDSGCSRHMIGNMSYLSDFKELNGGYVAFGGNPKGGKISRKDKIRTGKLYFDDVYFVKELKFNLFSVSQMCNKKNSVLFTDTECLVLSPEFKMPDESQVLLRVPRENNMYNVNLKNIVPSRDLTCVFTKATLDESNLWHKKPDHINFKTMNKLVKGNLVRGLPRKFLKMITHVLLVRKASNIEPLAEAVNTACYVQNRALVTKPHNKTPYELLHGRTPSSGFMRPFGCPVTILNTLDSLGKFDGNVDEGFLVGYSISSKDFRVFNNAFQLLDDPKMPELEDITYSDNEDDVGVKADFNNLETSITVSLIPTTRVYKDNPVTQIIDGKSASTPIDTEKPLLKDPDGVNTPRCDEDRLEVMELTVFLLPMVEKVRVEVYAVDLQVSAIRLMLVLLVQKFLLFVYKCQKNLWNEFSSSMASAVIRLSSGDVSTHTTKYTSPALIQKVFANMKRVGKGFLGVETPLFEGMFVEQQVAEEGDAEVHGEEANAGDAVEGDVCAANDEVPTVAEESSILSPTPPTPSPHPSHDIPSTS